MLRWFFWMSEQAEMAGFSAQFPSLRGSGPIGWSRSSLGIRFTSFKLFIWIDFAVTNSPNCSGETTIRTG